MKAKCVRCGSSRRKLKYYVIADDLENPRPYCKPCHKQLMMDILTMLSDLPPINHKGDKEV